ncbi:MAG: glycosyltransferase family 4 protein [Candidatus Tectomicrobia bacterium]|nr:glycosyltransferase family 4 protein [Candidatus Tectomicrobia bacterium]
MKLLALILAPESPSSRYRVAYLAPCVEACGWRVALRPAPRGWRQRRRCWADAAAFDVVLVQKKLLQPWEWRWLRQACRRLVFDFDDALAFHERSRAAPRLSLRSWKFHAALRAADLVLAGNSYLAELAAPWARRVVVLPTGVPVERYEPKPPATTGAAPGASLGLVLGWIGSRSTLGYLEALLPVLEELHRRRPEVRLKVVADAFPQSRSLPIEAVRWCEAQEAAQVASFDIGLMPLPDTPWTRGKCGLKLLQYLAAGVPVVASPVGVNKEIVRPGLNGYLAAQAREWLERLEELARQPALRARLGAWGRKDVEARFSLRRLGKQFADHLEELLRTGRVGGG